MSDDYPLLMLRDRAADALAQVEAAIRLVSGAVDGGPGFPVLEVKRAALVLIDSGLLLYGHSDDAELRTGIEKIRSACAAEINKQNNNNTHPRR